ncbi:MAG: hypothetical protein MPN21_16790 [Thermoanaerobaculia bacterium]|nr:hypothetical protein [Thermoanaerobaculia bacterium]
MLCTSRVPNSALFRARFLPLLLFLGVTSAVAQPETYLDLLTVQDGDGILQRIYGATGTGQYGVPVASGFDVDGDQIPDSAVAFMTASPNGEFRSGEVDLVFGTGLLDGSVETSMDGAGFLRIFGDDEQETAGSEIWMDDVTGDGIGDLLVCRQNYTLGRRIGAGALTILPGGPHLRTLAKSRTALQLASAPASVRETTIVGADVGDRFCIWTRTGDIDGDGTADLVVGADQEAGPASLHRGAVWVIRGGSHLDDGGLIDLADFGTIFDDLSGDIAHVIPPGNASHLHAGATCSIGDLDGDGRGEVIFASTLSRAGAILGPVDPLNLVDTHSSGGTARGTLYIAWDDLFPPTPWSLGYELTVPSTPHPDFTVLDGEAINDKFGEEIVAGHDLDGDGDPDLVVGDLLGDPDGRSNAGIGHVIFDPHLLRGTVSAVSSPPAGVTVSRVWGPTASDIGADTAALGDFDGDGISDLLFSSPHASPQGRFQAGQAHLLFGQVGAWPPVIDLANLPSPATFRVAQIDGKEEDDVLCYSAAAGDLDGDGRIDLAINEMRGDAPGANGVGNLLLVSGRTFDPTHVFSNGFETGDTTYWSATVP